MQFKSWYICCVTCMHAKRTAMHHHFLLTHSRMLWSLSAQLQEAIVRSDQIQPNMVQAMPLPATANKLQKKQMAIILKASLPLCSNKTHTCALTVAPKPDLELRHISCWLK